ncbi:MAG: helix-turn-helix domain-containing protein [Flavobacteriales bacterium]
MQYKLLDHTTKPYSRKYLKSIYILKNGDIPKTYGCVPNGEIGISVILRGNAIIHQVHCKIKQPALSVYGLVRRAQFHSMSAHYYEVNLGFEPYKLQLLLKERLSDLQWVDATPLDLLFKRNIGQELFEKLNCCRTDTEIQETIELFLMKVATGNRVNERVHEAHRIITQESVSSVNELAERLRISGAGLRQLFADKMGLSPKELMKIHRVRSAISTKHPDEESLTALAYALNYFDQAHFIHDFKESIGMTPRRYFANKKLTCDFYNYGRWDYSSLALPNM